MSRIILASLANINAPKHAQRLKWAESTSMNTVEAVITLVMVIIGYGLLGLYCVFAYVGML